MKKILYIAAILIGLTSCNSGGITLPNATGMAGEILVVIDDSIAKSAVGDSIFRLLDRDVPCLPQSEPHFNISTTPHSGFTNLIKPARNIIIINVGHKYSHNKIKTSKDRYSTPQSIIEINGPTKEGVRKAIADHGEDILNYFIKAERDKGKCIIYSTHYMEEAENICDRLVLINKGKIIAIGTPEKILKDTKTTNIRDAFFKLIGGVDNEME